VPNLNIQVKYGKRRLEYEAIVNDTTGARATTFTFPVPVLIKTDTVYAFVVKFDFSDTNFALWRNKVGETFNQAQSTAITTGALDGRFFMITNGTNITPDNDSDLKFVIRAQKFVKDIPYVFSAVGRDFEFLNVNRNTLQGEFIGGEYVFTNIPPPTGQTVSVSTSTNIVRGTNTIFQTTYSAGSPIILKSGDDYSVQTVNSISNNTYLTLKDNSPFTNTSAQYVVSAIARMFNFNQTRTYSYKTYSNTVLVVASSANTTYNFTPNSSSNTLVGEASNASVKIDNIGFFEVSKFEPNFGIIELPQTTANTVVKFANSSYGNSIPAKGISMGKEEISLSKGYVFSTTLEQLNGNSLNNLKSMNFDIFFGSNNEFITPMVDEEDLHFYVSEYALNDNTLGEHKRTGNAVSKYVSKPVVLSQRSEDLIVYLTGYRPLGTDIKVYAKLYNEEDIEPFDEKDWTQLELSTGKSLYSSAADGNDKKEYVYKLPNYPMYSYDTLSSGDLIEGTFIGTDYSKILISTNTTVNTYISNTDLVRIYNPLYPNNSLIAVVTASNTTSITIDREISSTNMYLQGFVSDGLIVQTVEYKNTAYKDPSNIGIARYFNSDMSAFDSFDSFSIKIVLTANSTAQGVPFVDDYRAIASTV
jgi:hypothetical protein